MVCTVGITGVATKKVKVENATLIGKLEKADFPKIKEQVPHMRFGDNIQIQALLY